MARRPSAPSPVALGIDRISKLANAGTAASRMDRAARAVVADWRRIQEPDVVERWAEALHADVAAGLVSAEEQLDDVDSSEPGAAKQAQAVVDGLKAVQAALAEELGRF